MPKILSEAAVAQYHDQGFFFPVPALTGDEAAACRAELEAYERNTGGPIASNLRHKVHLLFTWANDLVHHPRILDAAEDILGPDILCWTSTFFIKEARDPGFVSWHQDATYWGLDPDDVLTVWVALSDAPIESGSMKVIPGSHKWPQVEHRDTYHEHNLLSRGQEIAVEVNEDEGVFMPLRAGEASLHHVKLAHGSAPNTTDDRRIGLAIRYIPPNVRQLKVRDSAMLVRGTDPFGHYDMEPEPQSDLDPAALAAHQDAVARQLGALYQGTDKTEFRA
ncbi:MAG: phytanoyl-CoA dioxygenase family protein [Hyphomicrobiales bacterium]|nr:phytanoyl-CoA dioxygenase family protein [Hyphomicrobiales bacterium]